MKRLIIFCRDPSSEQCSHYAARYVTGVKLGLPRSGCKIDSWQQAYVRLTISWILPLCHAGIRAAALHAFDADKLENGRIEVRMAHEGETIVTLDGQERKLEPHMLLITDGVKPVAIAGLGW